MNNLTIERQNGNIPKSLPGEDHVSGFIAYMPPVPPPPTGEEGESGEIDSFPAMGIYEISTIDKAEEYGITANHTMWYIRALHYHLSEIFRTNPAISLYVSICLEPASRDPYSFVELKQLQNYANGSIRQMAVWCPTKTFAAEDVTKLQGIGDALDLVNAPLSILYAPKVTGISSLPTSVAGANQSRVSVVIAQDGSPTGEGCKLYTEQANRTAKNSVSCIGTVLGLLSRAKVHQSIGWVKNFPTGISLPAFSDGKLFRDQDKALIEQLDKARYIFFTTYVGQSGSYVNDSHTMDSAISDYAMIESVRTMDKAVRGIRAYLIPELGGNIYVDPDSGQMAAYSVSHLETVANKPLEDMEKAGELSGYRAEIDPAQDVLSTSEVEIVIKNVPVGVMRKIKVKIGFVKQL